MTNTQTPTTPQPEAQPAPEPKPVRKPKPTGWKRLRKHLVRTAAVFATITGLVVLGSCVHLPAENPAYAVDEPEIDADLERMRNDPVELPRPVIVLSGYRSPVVNARDLAGSIRDLTGAPEDRVIYTSYEHASTIEEPAQLVIDLVDKHFPTEDPDVTTEVDVVAISMGGLVARLAADEPEHRGVTDGGRRLNINTLYTFASPHRGARMAQYIRPDPAAADMRPGSRFIQSLNQRADHERYTLVPYATLHDRMVGATNTAPPGTDPIWVPGRVTLSHFLMVYEDRLLADLGRRLRGETPLGSPSTPPRD
ncbi:MAG: hypothetical protein AAF297_02315 [Planctomycetota bacterium]